MKRKNYNVLTVCNVDSYGYGINVNTSNFTLRQFTNLDMAVNAPMLARESLLAQLLRTGKHVTIPCRSLLGRERPKTIKDSPKHVGRLLGVEIEFYPLKTMNDSFPTNRLTRFDSDGSLDSQPRECSNGREIKRITWQDNTGRLQGLLGLKIQGRINRTCGLHVHVDARHLGTNGLLSPGLTYDRLTGFYPFLKSLCPRSRRTNSFCRWVNNRLQGARYAAINWHAFDKHGTIEFRCQGGSIDVLKIESWALLCQYLLAFAANPFSVIPSTWGKFTAILPEPLRTWAILRKLDLYGSLIVNTRSLSGVTIQQTVNS